MSANMLIRKRTKHGRATGERNVEIVMCVAITAFDKQKLML
jgi:hypothetical protein